MKVKSRQFARSSDVLAFSKVSWLGGVNLFDIILKLLVVENNKIIYVSVT